MKKKKEDADLAVEHMRERERAIKQADKFVAEQGFQMAFKFLAVSFLSIVFVLMIIVILSDISISTRQPHLFGSDGLDWLFGLGSVLVLALCFAVPFTMFNGFITHVLLQLRMSLSENIWCYYVTSMLIMPLMAMQVAHQMSLPIELIITVGLIVAGLGFLLTTRLRSILTEAEQTFFSKYPDKRKHKHKTK
ncbi:MAG: hypothetical protein AAFV98_20710 [Chloroflexota bacterium]